MGMNAFPGSPNKKEEQKPLRNTIKGATLAMGVLGAVAGGDAVPAEAQQVQQTPQKSEQSAATPIMVEDKNGRITPFLMYHGAQDALAYNRLALDVDAGILWRGKQIAMDLLQEKNGVRTQQVEIRAKNLTVLITVTDSDRTVHNYVIVGEQIISTDPPPAKKR